MELPPAITIPRRIPRSFIAKHPEYTFVYGGALRAGEQTFMGQGAAANGQPNCFMVPTKFRLCRSDSQAYFHDGKFEVLIQPAIEIALKRIPRDKPTVVFPRIGCGAADLPNRAPKTYAYLMQQLSTIQYPNIVWDNALAKYA